MMPEPLQGRETRVWSDGAYRGRREVIREMARLVMDFISRRARRKGVVDEKTACVNRTKYRVHARVEHAVSVIEGVFGFQKFRDRGLAKHRQVFVAPCALANLFTFRRSIWPIRGVSPRSRNPSRSIRHRARTLSGCTRQDPGKSQTKREPGPSNIATLACPPIEEVNYDIEALVWNQEIVVALRWFEG